MSRADFTPNKRWRPNPAPRPTPQQQRVAHKLQQPHRFLGHTPAHRPFASPAHHQPFASPAVSIGGTPRAAAGYTSSTPGSSGAKAPARSPLHASPVIPSPTQQSPQERRLAHEAATARLFTGRSLTLSQDSASSEPVLVLSQSSVVSTGSLASYASQPSGELLPFAHPGHTPVSLVAAVTGHASGCPPAPGATHFLGKPSGGGGTDDDDVCMGGDAGAGGGGSSAAAAHSADAKARLGAPALAVGAPHAGPVAGPAVALGTVVAAAALRGAAAPHADELVFFATGVRAGDIMDAASSPPQYQYTVTGRTRRVRREATMLATKVTVNGVELALFRYGSEVVATATKCPHQGGPLALGDIEDVGGQLCVTCPWHGFKFNLRTGTSVMPKESYTMGTYPVRLTSDGTVCVGFGELSDTLFDCDDF